jgi:ribonuclease VapC
LKIVLDTSAVIAVLSNEPDAPKLALKIASARSRFMAAPNVFEAFMVAESRWGPQGSAYVTRFLHKTDMDIRPFGRELVHLAQIAWRQYGKGRHPAALNFGDCMAYALAQSLKLPLLFKGNDFAQTDVAPA